MPVTEQDFDDLPEALRLALVERVRQQLSEQQGKTISLNLAQIGEAASIGRGTVHNRYRIAMMKLRAAADKRDL